MSGEIILNGKVYVEKTEKTEKTKEEKERVCCIIRTYSAGVFIGYIGKVDSKICTIYNSRRIWYWSGACSISQLAIEGSKDIENCKIAITVPETTLTEVIEVVPCTNDAIVSLIGAEVWKK